MSSIDRWIIRCVRRQRTEEMLRLGAVRRILALFGLRGVAKSSVRRPLRGEYFNCVRRKLAAFRLSGGCARRVRTYSFGSVCVTYRAFHNVQRQRAWLFLIRLSIGDIDGRRYLAASRLE